jgi:Spy/CpxP family protein refolding chaperone
MRERGGRGIPGVLLGAALLAATLAPASAGAQGWGGGGRGGGALMLPALLRSANLTPDQQTKMHDILKARRTAARPIVAGLRQAQQDLADKLLAPGTVGLADLQPQLDKITQQRGQLLQNSAQAALDIRAILTADQLAKAADTKDKLRQLRQEIHQLLQPSQP